MYALADCNNFYASCERVFNPYWVGRPVVVLSNNDGCVIARSNEAKRLGIRMGVPAYQIKEEVEKYNIGVFSSNYTLYGDMSNRVMNMLAGYVQDIEVYSIDEAFLDFHGFERYDLSRYGRQIVRQVTKGTGIPLSMGIAPTKTLAKVANKFSKKYPAYQGVCVIDSEVKRLKALQQTPIGDVWGIGRQHRQRLETQGVNTAYHFTQLPRAWVRKHMTVTGERTWLELNGQPCISLELYPPEKKQICTSRSFGQTVGDYENLSEAVATYAAICAEKLRRQQCCAAELMVFIHTNNFREDLPQYARHRVIKFDVPSNSTIQITKKAKEALKSIFRAGFQYKKAGVIITEIVPRNCVQLNVFDTTDHTAHNVLMEIIDKVNSGFTRNVLMLASQGTQKPWKLKREKLSGRFTTNLDEIIKIKL